MRSESCPSVAASTARSGRHHAGSGCRCWSAPGTRGNWHRRGWPGRAPRRPGPGVCASAWAASKSARSRCPSAWTSSKSCLGANAHRGGSTSSSLASSAWATSTACPLCIGIVLAQIPGPLHLMQQRLDRGVGPGQTLDIGNARKQVHEWTTASGRESCHHNAPVQPLVFPLGRGPAVSRCSNRAR